MARPPKYVKPGAKLAEKASPGLCRLTPGGSDPATSDQAWGGVPPCAKSATCMESPTVLSAGEPVVMASGWMKALTMRSEKIFWTMPAGPLAWMVKNELKVPPGVPERTPVVPFIVSPKGTPPRVVHVHGPPQTAWNVWLYAVPTVPEGRTPAVVMANGSTTNPNPS